MDSKLELWFTIIDDEVEVALAGVPEPDADDLIKSRVKIIPFVLGERCSHLQSKGVSSDTVTIVI